MKHLNIITIFTAAFICGCTRPAVRQCVKPLAPAVDLNQMTDGTYAAAFSVKDFNWQECSLSLTLFAEDVYDGRQIDNLQAGDTILLEGDTLIVNQLSKAQGSVEINGGIENGGACLEQMAGGNYRGVLWDCHSTYTELGKWTAPLADDFTIIDCGDEPQEPYDTIRSAQKVYLEGVKEYKQNFVCMNTVITVKDGRVSTITRRWIP